MAFTNLPGVFPEKQDGGLDIFTPEDTPSVVILGTASQGDADQITRVRRTQEAASAFGSDGTVTRGMYEVKTAGAKNVSLYRMGATSAKLEFVGDTGGILGYTVETSERDNTAGAIYSIFFDPAAQTDGLLMIFRASDGFLVFSNDLADPIDTLDVIVSGNLVGATTSGSDIGSVSAPVLMEDVVVTGTVFTAGTDGVNPSRMKLYEYLHTSYQLLENEDIDEVVPMDVYMDDLNIIDMTAGEITTLDLASLTDYPITGSTKDVLGNVFIEEYEGTTYFFWDMDNDGIAEIFPTGIGSADASTKIDGTGLTSADFTEVNFAYQLANFCYNLSVNNNECTGIIGTLPPLSFSPKDIANWVGSLPKYSVQNDGSEYIDSAADNGTGLLGNKFMAGKWGYQGSVKEGGFVATDSGNLNGTNITDSGGHIIDIGKYISIVPGYPVLSNASAVNVNGYIASGASTYAGFYSTLDSKSAPTNKVLKGLRMPNRLSNAKLDLLAGAKYTMFAEKPKGVVVSDAPTAARQDSDYQRLSTVRIVKDVVDVVRSVADPFIGEANTAQRRAALKTAAEAGLLKLQKAGYIQRFNLAVTATPQQQVQGDANIDLVIVPAFELRQITIVLSLSAI